ncbi:hypothetical protein BJ165DRAFT_1530330 [Panaeolus papilionaceus]|nr:hypothetical protein BJ165DRAFT_1530330 [Panaeolus papilionaceus]
MIFNPSTILIALLSAAACLASPTASEEVTLAKRVPLSIIDLEAACQEQYGDVSVTIITGTGCYDWQCVNNNENVNISGMDLNAYCVRHHGVNAYASCRGTILNWECLDRS